MTTPIVKSANSHASAVSSPIDGANTYVMCGSRIAHALGATDDTPWPNSCVSVNTTSVNAPVTGSVSTTCTLYSASPCRMHATMSSQFAWGHGASA